MTTGERAFGGNRHWLLFYVALSAAVAAVLALMVMLGCYELLFSTRGGAFMMICGMIMSGAMLLITTAFAENLVRFVIAGGPALTISDEGIRYRIASDDLVPWSKVRGAALFFNGFRSAGVRLELSRDFSDAMRWRGVIANSYKLDTLNVRFWFIDAPKAEVAKALLRHQSVVHS